MVINHKNLLFVILIGVMFIPFKTSAQEINKGVGTLDSCFINEVYKSVFSSAFSVLKKEYCPFIEIEDIRLSKVLSDTIPIIYFDYSSLSTKPPLKKLSKKPRIDLTDPDLKEYILTEAAKSKPKPYINIDCNQPFTRLKEQSRYLDLTTCESNCSIEFSFSTIFLQEDIIHGYVYFNILKNTKCYKKTNTGVYIFALDDWDNYIETKVEWLLPCRGK